MLRSIKGTPVFAGIILLVFFIVGLLGPLLAPHNPNDAIFEDALRPPFWLQGGKVKYPLGTDYLGRDILSRVLCGAGVSLQVAFFSVALSGIIGASIALLSGYLGGWIDTILMRFTDIVISMPYIMIAIVMAAILGPSKGNIIIIFAVTSWAGYARVLRGEVLRIKEEAFVSLAVVAGCSKGRIMIRHIFPNMVNTLVVLATLWLGIYIFTESVLSFLGVGVPAPDPAWGSMIAEGRPYISSAWWLCTWPGLAMFLVILSCNLFGDWLRIRLDPKFRQV